MPKRAPSGAFFNIYNRKLQPNRYEKTDFPIFTTYDIAPFWAR